MKITVDEKNIILIEEVYNPIKLLTEDSEEMYIIMRDSGFEFTYQGEKYYAKNGEVKKF